MDLKGLDYLENVKQIQNVSLFRKEPFWYYGKDIIEFDYKGYHFIGSVVESELENDVFDTVVATKDEIFNCKSSELGTILIEKGFRSDMEVYYDTAFKESKCCIKEALNLGKAIITKYDLYCEFKIYKDDVYLGKTDKDDNLIIEELIYPTQKMLDEYINRFDYNCALIVDTYEIIMRGKYSEVKKYLEGNDNIVIGLNASIVRFND